MTGITAGELPPAVALLVLAGVSLSAVFLLGRGLFPNRRWVTVAGHGGLVCLGVCTLQLGTRMFRVAGADRLRYGLVVLVFVLVLGVLCRRLFNRPPRGR